jgi:hypothetical protein
VESTLFHRLQDHCIHLKDCHLTVNKGFIASFFDLGDGLGFDDPGRRKLTVFVFCTKTAGKMP